MIFAVETGMRRGEIANVKEEHLTSEVRNLLYIPETKTDIPRTVPLSRRAQEAFEELLRSINGCGKISAESVSQAFSRACMRHGIEGLRFHDLRHSAASYLAMNGASMLEIAEILGHKTLQMVKRYAHLSETHTANIVAAMNEQIFR